MLGVLVQHAFSKVWKTGSLIVTISLLVSACLHRSYFDTGEGLLVSSRATALSESHSLATLEALLICPSPGLPTAAGEIRAL